MGNQNFQQMIYSRQAFQNNIFELEKQKEQISIEQDRLLDEIKKTKEKLSVDKQMFEFEILKLEKALEQILIDRTRLDNKISKANNKLKVLNTQLLSIEKNKLLAAKASENIKNRLNRVNSNTEELIQLRKNAFQDDGESDKLALLMYSNIVQQNISFSINLQRRIEDFEKELNQYQNVESRKKSEIDDINIEIRNLVLKRDKELSLKESKISKNIMKLKVDLEKTVKIAAIRVQELSVKRNKEFAIKTEILNERSKTLQTRLATLSPLEVNQRPFSSPNSVKPARTKIILLAAFLACFLAIISSFLWEFWRRNKERITANAQD